MARLVLLLAFAALAGCDILDPLETDPNVAHIEAVTLTEAPVGDERLFIRLATRSDTTDTEPTSGPAHFMLAVPYGFAVMTNEGRFWDGEPLTVEVRRCAETCDTSMVVGRGTVAPDEWDGTERSVTVGDASVTLTYRKTSS